MDLQEVWKKLETETLEKPVTGSLELKKKSKHPIQKLKDAYLKTTGFAVFFLIGFMVMLFIFPSLLIKLLLTLVIIAYIFFFVVNYSMYRKINTNLPMDQSLKDALQHTYDFITANILFQERVSIFIYPVAGATGFFIGGSSDLEKMTSQKSLIILLITLIIITPVCFFVTRWFYKISYGKCLHELKERIAELEKPD
jgi:hypothetical protein